MRTETRISVFVSSRVPVAVGVRARRRVELVPEPWLRDTYR
jgi:hypothetical protein